MFGSFLNLFLLILHIGQTGSFPPPLSEKEEKELVEKMLKGDDSARSKLIEHNMRLVAHIVKKYYASAEDQNDLISIGSIGLIKGIRTQLDDRERTIIELRYGLTEPPLTQKQTAQRLGVSRSYISRLEKKALLALREYLQKTPL